MSFEKLNLIEPILKALKNEGYVKPTRIQEQAIPVVMAKKDLLGCAQTGTGKTAAFAIPILQLLFSEKNTKTVPKEIKALILTPTRELAVQIGESFAAYGKYTGLRHTVVFGGLSQRPQVLALRTGVDILIATPGRLLDLIEQGFISLSNVAMFVLDEADRMLDMGFIDDVQRIIAKMQTKKQTLFFSATMPPQILNLAGSILKDPVKIAVTPIASTVDMISQAVYFVNQADKKSLLLHLLRKQDIDSALIFTRTKHGANRITKEILNAGIHAEAIHGNKSQNARQKALNNFKAKRTKILVATDIAARGIDVEELSHVINYELPNIPETYVHRIGRTGRAGLKGVALSFCDQEEKDYLHDIHKLISKTIPVIEDHPYSIKNNTNLNTFSLGKSKTENKKSHYTSFNKHKNNRISRPNYKKNTTQTNAY